MYDLKIKVLISRSALFSRLFSFLFTLYLTIVVVVYFAISNGVWTNVTHAKSV